MPLTIDEGIKDALLAVGIEQEIATNIAALPKDATPLQKVEAFGLNAGPIHAGVASGVKIAALPKEHTFADIFGCLEITTGPLARTAQLADTVMADIKS